MPLRIINVNNGTEPEEEYVMLKAYSNINLEGYAVVGRDFLHNETEHQQCDKKIRHIYNFPNKRIKKGEYVLLVTGIGSDKKYTDIEGDTIHKFHWNSEECIWNNAGDEAVLICYEVMSKQEVPPVDPTGYLTPPPPDIDSSII